MKLRTARQDKKHFSSTVCGFSIAALFQEQQIFKISNNSWSGSSFLLLKKQITHISSTSLLCDREEALTVSFDSSSGFTSSEQEAVLPGSQGVAPKLINPASGLWESSFQSFGSSAFHFLGTSNSGLTASRASLESVMLYQEPYAWTKNLSVVFFP